MKIKVNKFVREYLEEFKILTIDSNCRLKAGEIIRIPSGGFMEEYSTVHQGDSICQMGSFSYSNAIIPRLDIQMGRYCSVALGLNFIAAKHPLDTISTSPFIYEPKFFKDAALKWIDKDYTYTLRDQLVPPPPPTIFENDVYVCTNALLKPGIRLHTGCVVAQNAIVTKDVPPYAIVGGSPARVLKYRFDEPTIKRLLELKWWEYHFADFDGINAKQDINHYLDQLEERIQKGLIKPFNPRKMQFEELIARSKQQVAVAVSTQPAPPKPATPQPSPQELEIKALKEQLAQKEQEIKNIKDKFDRQENSIKSMKNEINQKDNSIKTLEISHQKALKFKNHLSYKLGEALIRANKTWYKGGYVKFIFELIRINKEHKNCKPN